MTEHDEPPAPPEPALLRAEITGLERFGRQVVRVEFRSGDDQQLWRTTLPPEVIGDVLECSFARESGDPFDHGTVELRDWTAPKPDEGDLTVRLSDPVRNEWERVGPMGGVEVRGVWRLAFKFQAPKD